MFVTRRWLVLGCALLAAALVWWVVDVSRLPAAERGNAGGYGQFILAAIGLPISVVAAWKAFVPARAEPGLDELSDVFARAMTEQWTSAAAERRLSQPAPLPVRWRRARELTGPASAATVGALFEPLPGFPRVTTGRLAKGSRRDLLRVYSGLASGRLLIVGGPGTGKSSAAVLLLLDALRHREQTTDPADRARIPVPVFFTLHDWDPDRQSVVSWLSAKLTEIPLFRGKSGEQRAAALLAAGRVAVFLDGLDEIGESLRPPVLQALSDATFRVVLLSRTTELAKAAQRHGLVGAVALELEQLTPSDVAEYLLRPITEPAPAAWQKVTASLTDSPDGPLAAALTTPLGVSLVRDTYLQGDPVDELLDEQRFPTADITSHLLDRAVTVAYTPRPGRPRPRYPVATAQRTCVFLARTLDDHGTRDLAWWHVADWVPRVTRMLINSMCAALLHGLVIGFFGLLLGLATLGFLLGMAFGAAFGLLEGFIGAATPTAWGRRFNAAAILDPTTLFFMALAGGIGGLAAGFLFGPAQGGLVGAAGALATYGAFALMSDTEGTTPAGPVAVRWGDLSFKLGTFAAIGALFGVVYGVVSSAPMFAMVPVGIVVMMAIGLQITEAWTMSTAAIYLRVRHGVPLRLNTFLEDARHRNLLRTVGPIYQFRHALLQDRLAR